MNAKDQDQDRIKKVLESLIEHFDAVQIFASRHESGEYGGTVNINEGRGNWYARYGQVRDWLIAEEESARQKIRKDE